MSLQEFTDVLLTAVGSVYHLKAPADVPDEYVIWQETGGRSLYASDVRSETVRTVQVELYTGREYTETVDRILDVLERKGIAFQEPEPHFDPDTGKTRYTIPCETV